MCLVCLQARYDEELKVYLKTTGLRSCDLVKPKAKKSKSSPAASQQQRRPAGAPVSSMPAARSTADQHHHQQLQQPQHAHVTANHQQQQLQVTGTPYIGFLADCQVKPWIYYVVCVLAVFRL